MFSLLGNLFSSKTKTGLSDVKKKYNKNLNLLKEINNKYKEVKESDLVDKELLLEELNKQRVELFSSVINLGLYQDLLPNNRVFSNDYSNIIFSKPLVFSDIDQDLRYFRFDVNNDFLGTTTLLHLRKYFLTRIFSFKDEINDKIKEVEKIKKLYELTHIKGKHKLTDNFKSKVNTLSDTLQELMLSTIKENELYINSILVGSKLNLSISNEDFNTGVIMDFINLPLQSTYIIDRFNFVTFIQSSIISNNTTDISSIIKKRKDVVAIDLDDFMELRPYKKEVISFLEKYTQPYYDFIIAGTTYYDKSDKDYQESKYIMEGEDME